MRILLTTTVFSSTFGGFGGGGLAGDFTRINFQAVLCMAVPCVGLLVPFEGFEVPWTRPMLCPQDEKGEACVPSMYGNELQLEI